jgi:hypothetical protein
VGRGRAKAKQIKVARKLKYFSPDTDLNALQRELGSESEQAAPDFQDDYAEDPDDDYSDYADKYAEWADVIEESESKDHDRSN